MTKPFLKLVTFAFVMLFITAYSPFALAEAKEVSSSIRFSGIPALGYSADTGFGFGVVGNMYVDHPEYTPYKMSLGLKVYFTTKGTNSHHFLLDRVDAFGLPLRLIGRVGFYSSIAQNYCGKASDANCDEDRAKIEGGNLGLQADTKPYNEFIHRYYLNRTMSIFGDLMARYLLWKDIARLELMMSYRGRYYLNRDFQEKGPYPNSLYDLDFHDSRIDGYLSTLEVGLMLDKRDIEAAPTSGYWHEASIRGGSWLIGSAWNYFGANAAARFYIPLDAQKKVVIASQTIGDIIVGDLPYDAMSRLGGSQSLVDLTAIGGQSIGRGIREQRFVGRIKAIEQLEFRYTFYSFDLLKQNFDLTAALMGDFGMTAWDFSRFTKDMQNFYAGFGGGLRIGWNKTFIIRADLGFSPTEKFAPQFYLVVGNVF